MSVVVWKGEKNHVGCCIVLDEYEDNRQVFGDFIMNGRRVSVVVLGI